MISLSVIKFKTENGFLPYFIQALCKQNFVIKKIFLLNNEDNYEFYIGEFQSDSVTNLDQQINKLLAKYQGKYEILEIKNDLDEKLKDGLLQTRCKYDFDRNRLEIQLLELLDAMQERVADNLNDYTSYNKSVAVVGSIDKKSDDILIKNYSALERDALLISELNNLNGHPILITMELLEDFSKTIKRIGNGFSMFYVSHIKPCQDYFFFETITDEIDSPILTYDFDEVPLILLTAINKLIDKKSEGWEQVKIGFIGISAGVMRLARILKDNKFHKVWGFDNRESFMHAFEKCGGIATAESNIFENADIIIINKKQYSQNELEKIHAGQNLISNLEDSCVEKEIALKNGIAKFLGGNWIKHSVFFPYVLQGMSINNIPLLLDSHINSLALSLAEIPVNGSFIPQYGDEVRNVIINSLSVEHVTVEPIIEEIEDDAELL